MKSLLLLCFFLIVAASYAQDDRKCFCFILKNGSKPLPIKFDVGDWKNGTVQYKGQNEKVKVTLTKSRVQRYTPSGSAVMEFTWNEIVNGKVTGKYIILQQGINTYFESYVRLRDNKKFTF